MESHAPRAVPVGPGRTPPPGFSLGEGMEASQAWGRVLQVILSKNIGSGLHDPLFINLTVKLSLKYQHMWYYLVT